MINQIVRKIQQILVRRSSDTFTRYLTNNGVSIGDGTYFQDPKYTEIDLTRPSLVTIGKICFLISMWNSTLTTGCHMSFCIQDER